MSARKNPSRERLYPDLRVGDVSPGSGHIFQGRDQKTRPLEDDSDSEDLSHSDEHDDDDSYNDDHNDDNDLENTSLNRSTTRRTDKSSRESRSHQISSKQPPTASPTRRSPRFMPGEQMTDTCAAGTRKSERLGHSPRSVPSSGFDYDTSTIQVNRQSSGGSPVGPRDQLSSRERPDSGGRRPESGDVRSYTNSYRTDSIGQQDSLRYSENLSSDFRRDHQESSPKLNRRPLTFNRPSLGDSTAMQGDQNRIFQSNREIKRASTEEIINRRNSSERSEGKSKSTNNDFTIDKIIPIFILACACIVAALYVFTHSGSASVPVAPRVDPSAYQTFQDSLKELKIKFPAQSDGFWKSIRVGTRPIMEQEEPISPAVFIFVANTESSLDTTRCIARKFAEVVTRAFSGSRKMIEIDGNMSGSPGDVKIEIDEKIGSGLSRGSHAVIVNGVERLHGESTMIFHGYCDNENAQYTRVAYIFTLLTSGDIRGGSAEQEGDRFVERVLAGRWRQHLRKDMLDPLLGRIGNANVFINPESEDNLSAIGCR